MKEVQSLFNPQNEWFLGVGDSEVRRDALYSMSQVLRHSKEAKGLFIKLRVFWNGQPTEAIQAVMKIVFNANDHLEVISARSVLIGFFHEYPEGQLWILGNTQDPSSIFLDVFYTMETVKDGLELGKRSTQVWKSRFTNVDDGNGLRSWQRS